MRKQTKLVAALSATALLAIGASAVTFAAGWNNSTGEWQYLDNEGNAVTDAWRKSGDYWFYLGADGNMAKNEVVQNNDEYYFVNGDGAMVTNQWVSFDEATDDGNAKRWMYLGADGKAYRDKNGELKVADIRNSELVILVSVSLTGRIEVHPSLIVSVLCGLVEGYPLVSNHSAIAVYEIVIIVVLNNFVLSHVSIGSKVEPVVSGLSPSICNSIAIIVKVLPLTCGIVPACSKSYCRSSNSK